MGRKSEPDLTPEAALAEMFTLLEKEFERTKSDHISVPVDWVSSILVLFKSYPAVDKVLKAFKIPDGKERFQQECNRRGWLWQGNNLTKVQSISTSAMITIPRIFGHRD